MTNAESASVCGGAAGFLFSALRTHLDSELFLPSTLYSITPYLHLVRKTFRKSPIMYSE